MNERWPGELRDAPANKAPEALRTIGEVAAELGLRQHVLRHWEGQFSQLQPLRRDGDRRYYRPDDIRLLRGIRELLYTDGYTIRGVQKLLRQAGAKAVIIDRGEGRAAAALPEEAREALRAIRSELERLRDLLDVSGGRA